MEAWPVVASTAGASKNNKVFLQTGCKHGMTRHDLPCSLPFSAVLRLYTSVRACVHVYSVTTPSEDNAAQNKPKSKLLEELTCTGSTVPWDLQDYALEYLGSASFIKLCNLLRELLLDLHRGISHHHRGMFPGLQRTANTAVPSVTGAQGWLVFVASQHLPCWIGGRNICVLKRHDTLTLVEAMPHAASSQRI